MSASDLNSSTGTIDNSKPDDSLRSDSGVFDESCRSLPGQNRPSSPEAESVEHTLLQYAKTQYNISRKVIIKNIPPTTYNEVKQFLGSYSVKNILLSKRNRQAVICLANGNQAEDLMEKLDKSEFMGQIVDVNLYRNENFLCVAHLPLNITDQDFKGLVTELGPTERCFLMRDTRGKSKGYGFVEYSHNFEKTKQACSLLDNKRMGSCTLHCEFLKDSILTFDDLNSSCLFVDHLPPNYSDTAEFNQIFSSINKPQFCEIGRENGKSLGFGIVEFAKHTEAEEAFKRLHGKTIKHYTVRVTYCIPGLSAKEVYEKQIKSLITTTPRSGGLLPSPFLGQGGMSVVSDALANPVMKSLLSQSPKVLENFETILTDLYSHLSGKEQDAANPGDLAALSDPNLQVSILACILTTQLQENQPALFNNPIVQQFLKTNSGKSSEEKSEAEKLSLLGNPLLAQACRLLEDLCKDPPRRSKDGSTEQPGEGQNGAGGEAPERKVGLLGDSPGSGGGSVTGGAPTAAAADAKSTDVYAGLLEGINPLLALIIEAQIRQQLQGIQTLSLLSSVSGMSKLPLLGNPPDNAKDNQFVKNFSGKRKALMGDAPPGHEDFSGNAKGGSGGGQQNPGPEMWAQWSQSNKPSGQPDQSDGNWSQMCQMYQQYLQQLNQSQQGVQVKPDPDDMGSGSASDAVYSSGIASQSAFSTNIGTTSSFPSFNFQQATWFNPNQQGFKAPNSNEVPRFKPSNMGPSSRNSDAGYQNKPGPSKNAPPQNPYNQRQGSQDGHNAGSRPGSASSFGSGQGSGYNGSQMSSGNYNSSSQQSLYNSQSQSQHQGGRQQSGSSHHSYNPSQGLSGSSSHHQQNSRQQQMGPPQSQQPLLQTPQQHPGQQQQQQQHHPQHQQQQQQQQQGRPSLYQQSQSSHHSQQPPAPPSQSMFNQNMYGAYSTKGPETYSTSTGRNSPPHPQNQESYTGDSYNMSSHSGYGSYNDKFSPTVASTPVLPQQGVKRSLGLLPSPEPSPDGSYIGQHSQGLGGHYADSYLKKRRL